MLFALLPSTKQMAVLIVVPKILNNEHVKQLPDKLIALCNDWLDKLGPNKTDKK
jgi:hypothetical protein